MLEITFPESQGHLCHLCHCLPQCLVDSLQIGYHKEDKLCSKQLSDGNSLRN